MTPEFFNELVEGAMLRHNLNKKQVMKSLGISKTTYYKWAKEGVPQYALIDVLRTLEGAPY